MAIDIRALARDGARTRIEQLLAELAEIRRSFPGITTKSGDPSSAPARRSRRPMTAAERKAVAVRMKAYWAARRMGKK